MRYTQVKLEYIDGSFETAWIPSEHAKKNNFIKVGKKKDTAKGAIILEVFSTEDSTTLDHLKQAKFESIE